MTQEGDLRATGPTLVGKSAQSRRSLGFRVGIVRWAMCPYSWTARISPQLGYEPKLGLGVAGVGHRKVTGPSISGTTNPFGML